MLKLFLVLPALVLQCVAFVCLILGLQPRNGLAHWRVGHLTQHDLLLGHAPVERGGGCGWYYAARGAAGGGRAATWTIDSEKVIGAPEKTIPVVELYLLVNFHAVDTGSSPGQWGQVETVITLAVNGAMLSLQQTGG